MTGFSVTSPVTPADMEAALQFLVKRVRRHGGDPLEGMPAALYAIMYQVADCLISCDLPPESVRSVFDQTRDQTIDAVKAARRK